MIDFPFLNKLRLDIRENKNQYGALRNDWILRNSYYYDFIVSCLHHIIPGRSKVLHLGCGTGYLLGRLDCVQGVGIDDTEDQIAIARKTYPFLKFHCACPEEVLQNGLFDHILITSTEDLVDIKAVMDSVKKTADRHTRITMVTYSYLWQPLVMLAERWGMKVPQKLHNWLAPGDIENLLSLSGYEIVHTNNIVLFPFYVPVISTIINRFLGRLPFFRMFGMIRLTTARVRAKKEKEHSVSVVIPCRNEAGNIQDAVERIPEMGSHTEIIFCDDKSTDGTADKVREMMSRFPDRDIKLVDGPGICKADNVWTGFDHATGDILMILDADLTVIPEELPYFYEAITEGYGEFINGSRLVYPMHDDAMRFANVIGNKFFSSLFSYILDTRIKDTLCGTKVMWRSDYQNIKKLRGYWGIKDRWGDYELIFGAAKNNLKIIDLPVHYMERTYGETKMKGRFKQGVIMLRMSLASLWKLKFH